LGPDIATLDRAAQVFRAELWDGACEEAIEEAGIAERHFGSIQANVIEALPDAPAFNTVLGAAEAGAVEKGHLAEAIEWADSFDVDYRVLVGQDRPGTAATEAWLDRHGFEQGHALVRYARKACAEPEIPGPPGIEVWELGEPGEEDLGGETMVFSAGEAMDLPLEAACLLCDLPRRAHWRCYSVELEDDIVAYGSMLICDGVAVLGLDATEEHARRRGCHQALLRRRIIDAYEAGCETVFAGVPVYGADNSCPIVRNLVRAGFVPAHRSVNWRRPR
jgi:GNAT superfamily N-acetyltransferase